MFIHNISNSEKTYIGASIQPDEFYQVEESKKSHYANDEKLITDIMNSDATISVDGIIDIENKNAMVNYMKNNAMNLDGDGYEIISSNQNAFASNKTQDGKELYLKIHGIKAIVAANGEHEFQLTIPYGEAYVQGAEIFVNILAQTDMTIKHPTYGIIEQYGFDVCMGEVIYKREAQYAARLPQGMIVSAKCKNTEPIEQEMGVNFILHEVRNV